MTPTPSHGLPPASESSPALRIVELFPPRTLDAHTARQVAAFLDPCAPLDWLAAQLGREPRQRDAFVLIAHVDAIAVALCKLQHSGKRDPHRPGLCWIRDLVVNVRHRRGGIGSALLRRAFELVHPHEQLAVEVREGDTAAQLFFCAAGLECRHPADRSRRQRDSRLYEFRSVRPSAPPWLGRPRFTWPPA